MNIDLKSIFKVISAVAKTEKTPVYIVGGFVRDYLMGREQSKDVDFVVVGSGLAFAKALDKKMKEAGSLVEFADFDTARYVFEDGLTIEFAGARAEKYHVDSRKPAVAVATLEHDLQRRDFTVNAMAIAVADFVKMSSRDVTRRGISVPSSERTEISRRFAPRNDKCVIVDLFNGQKDLEDKILRTPLDPDITFSDDPLRMMRAIRFAAQLNFSIEPKILEAIHRNRERIKIVSAERVQEELMKLMATDAPGNGLVLMFQTHLMDLVLPEVSALDGVEEIWGHQHKNNLVHTFKVVDNIAVRSDKPLLRLAGLFHDIGKTGTKHFASGVGWTFHGHEHLGKKLVSELMKRLRFSINDIKYIAKLVRYHQQPIALMDEGITDSAVRRLVVNLGDYLEDLLILGVSDITTGNPTKLEKRQKNYEHLRARIDEVLEKDKLRAFQSPFRGDEIMSACGLKPGPTVVKIKEAIEEAILEGEISNEYDDAKKYFEKIKDEYMRQALDWEKIKNKK